MNLAILSREVYNAWTAALFLKHKEIVMQRVYINMEPHDLPDIATYEVLVKAAGMWKYGEILVTYQDGDKFYHVYPHDSVRLSRQMSFRISPLIPSMVVDQAKVNAYYSDTSMGPNILR